MKSQITTTIIEIFEIIFDFLISLFIGTPGRKKGYNAGFASEGSLLSSFNYGFNLTGKKQLSRKHSYQNALCIGGTGTGKSSVVLIPSIFSTQGSFIINDPSGELYSKTAGYLQAKGYDIKVLNWADYSRSSAFNPLSRAKTSSDVQKISSMLVENSLGGAKSKGDFWNIQSVALLSMLINILKKHEPEYINLYNVRQLLNQLGGNPQAMDALFSQYADEALFAEYKSFISFDEKVVSGVIATCKASLQIFADEAVAKVTSHDQINFMDFRTRPTALFINNSVADQKYYSVITSLFFEQFFSFLLSRFPDKKEQDIYLLIDEASSLTLPTLPLAVANVRKHRAGIMILVQDFDQLVHQYGKQNAGAIKSNCFARLFLTGQSLETCKELSEMLGKYEYEDDKKKTTITRSVMTPDEIRTMKQSRALLICGHYQPVICHLKPYYKRIRYKQYGLIPAPGIDTPEMDTIPVLPLNSPKYHEQEA